MDFITLEKLQYNELKHQVQAHCVSGLGKHLLEKLEPSTTLQVVQTRLNETTKGRTLLDAEGHIPFTGITNIEATIKSLEKGQILHPTELLAFSDFLRGCRRLKQFMEGHTFLAPLLASYAGSMTELKGLEEEINQAITGSRVDSRASRELRRIRQAIEATEEKIKDRLNKFLNSAGNKTYIQEFFITKKDDRFTIPIKASYKNQVSGSVIEVSAKGATVFIEPQTIAKLNEQLTVLKTEEAIEEYQILATLTGMALEQLHPLQINLELVSHYDMVFAKAKYSKQISGSAPSLNEHGYIRLVESTHPLLPSDAVPLNFEVGNTYRSLVITGPNAGGKTLVLKTIGLLTLATMSGFHIHAKPGTEIAVFDQIFADIGDNQSLENALSTFSSHMKHLSEILARSKNNTLLLFDEIGSGTEPNEGAALAISILEEFYLKGCITVATTHYGEIKRFSEQHSDFMNAAMQFNPDTLEPQYKLLIGTSGDSNALWISRKMNIPEHVVVRAKAYIDSKSYTFERVHTDRIKKPAAPVQAPTELYPFERGDRVILTDRQETALIYEGPDSYGNLTVFYEDEFLTVHARRVSLDIPAKDLYPEGYDIDALFVDYKTRKREHDITRGSKKALRQLQKEMRNPSSD